VSEGVVTIEREGSYTITGASAANRVVVAAGVTATVTLDNVSITSATASPFELNSAGCNVTIRLVGNNSLVSTVANSSVNGTVYGAGLQVEGTSSVTIGGEEGSSLTATGSAGAAGIGGGYKEGDTGHPVGNITIHSGAINAIAGEFAAGIGGGALGSAVNIIINGGVIMAKSGTGGAGIGGGYHGGAGRIVINGGTITAGTTGINGPGIGGGEEGTGGSVTINGGTITAQGATCGAGIGGGHTCTSIAITISGGFVVAGAGAQAAAIGGGTTKDGGNINISGGTVLALGVGGQFDPAAIGGGAQGAAGNIQISGGGVFAYGNTGSGIGGGAGASGGNINISGGTVVANKIGISASPSDTTGDSTSAQTFTAVTPTTVTNGLIITDSINAIVFGNAGVITGATLTETFVRAMAYRAAEPQTIFFQDTVPTTRHETIQVVQHDTLLREVPVTVTVHDSIPLIVRDTLRDTAFRYIRDTLVQQHILTLHDTLHITLHDTLPYIIWDTLYVPVPDGVATQYIFIDHASGLSTPVNDQPLTLIPAGNDLYYIQGLAADRPFAIYDLRGALVLKADKQPVRIVPHGILIVAQGGRYWKLIR